jgi:hypothetical protein
LFTSGGDTHAVEAAVDLRVGKHSGLIDVEVQKSARAEVERPGLPLDEAIELADPVEELFHRAQVADASVTHGNQTCTLPRKPIPSERVETPTPGREESGPQDARRPPASLQNGAANSPHDNAEAPTSHTWRAGASDAHRATRTRSFAGFG